MSIFSNFSGGQERRANRKAQATIGQGYGDARDVVTTAYDQATGYINPYLDNGQSQSFYDNLIYNNDGGASAAQVMGNPLFSGVLQNEQNALLRNMNARGMSGSGAAQLAAARVNQEDAYRRLGLYRDRAQMGGQYAGQAAGLATGYGNSMAGLYSGEAGAKAGLQQQMGSTYNTGMNNLIGMAGIATQALGMPVAPGLSLGGSLMGYKPAPVVAPGQQPQQQQQQTWGFNPRTTWGWM